MSARAASAAAFRAPGRVPDGEDVEPVWGAFERFDLHLAAVIADGAGQEQREAERPDLAEQHRRKRVATHAATVSRGRAENNVLSYASKFLHYAGPAIDPGMAAAAATT